MADVAGSYRRTAPENAKGEAAIIDIPEEEDDNYKKSEKAVVDDLSFVHTVREQVTTYVLEHGKEQAQKAYNLYANIDILRPYFHVEVHELRSRLLESMVPAFNSSNKPVLAGELYGPLMVVLTLIALLLFGMKSSGHVVKEGTLMGTAFGICFGYWLGISLLIYFLCYVCNTHISYLQTLSLLGYGLFGHCVALFLGTIFHPAHSHLFFYVVWMVFGGLSALRLVTIMMARTAGASQRLVVCSAAASLHLLFLLYLHFAYHRTVQVFDQI